MHLTYAEATNKLRATLERAGVEDTFSREVAEMVLEGEAKEGIGLFILRHGLERIKKEGADHPKITFETPASALVWGGNNLGEYAGLFALRTALQKAAALGVAVVGVTNHLSFSLLSSLTERAAEHGFVCLVFCSTPSYAVPTNGMLRSLGTNPLAISIPSTPHPFTLDMATTNVILTEVRMAAEEGRKLKEGLAVDKSGRPTTDAREALEGALTTFGGYKGSGLSIMISLLAGPLLGIRSSFSEPNERGMLIVLFRPEILRPGEGFVEDVQTSLRVFRERGSAQFRLPGDTSRARMERAEREGLEIPGKYADFFTPA